MVEDPVCGMQIDPNNAAGSFEYQGQTYYFCSQACYDAFQSSPEMYASE